MSFKENKQANESLSQYKLLSAYGGAGSILHTQYGSIIVSCIEEWGFLKKAKEVLDELNDEKKLDEKLQDSGLRQCKDQRLLRDLKFRKNLTNLKSLILIPNIEVKEHDNQIKDNKAVLAINSTFMPKNFSDTKNILKAYDKWYNEWVKSLKLINYKNPEDEFFPPKFLLRNKEGGVVMENYQPKFGKLKQDNIVTICDHGHISSFPWSKYLRWKKGGQKGKDIFNMQDCCNDPVLEIKENQGSGFDGKELKCYKCDSATSLKGLFSIKVKCPGQLPWHIDTGESWGYRGIKNKHSLPHEDCSCESAKVVLTTANNLYFARNISSIYIPDQLYKSFSDDILEKLEAKKIDVYEDEGLEGQALKERTVELVGRRVIYGVPYQEHPLWVGTVAAFLDGGPIDDSNFPTILDGEENEQREIAFRFKEYNVLTTKDVDYINCDKDKDLWVQDVTENLAPDLTPFFSRVLRVDKLMVTTSQLDFSRVRPLDADAQGVIPQSIFRSKPHQVKVYPAVESYGEGIFFALDEQLVEKFVGLSEPKEEFKRYRNIFERPVDSFAAPAREHAKQNRLPLYLIHTFSHLIMRELEFQCGYPTASLSERLYISDKEDTKMYGVLIYTSEGAEGSMGGLIAQTRKENLNLLIRRALERATICSSDPLCWESEGQGLFELNLASCFSCSLVSETSCEKRNMYLDRRILVDEEFGFFKDVVNVEI
ncbi:DUF1998 domain-containing protein [uncultured Pontibacter sp.]|uniref:DUF1998 domain-containing protein n=1 Tax=uncultured Pontibacter sp. TaxID=453356 RepID=UPI00261D43BE|nr:DUF1998 domain-containing protein [uncultured Pontibacter sp.]